LGLQKINKVCSFVQWIKLYPHSFYCNIFGFKFFIKFILFFNFIPWYLIFILNLVLILLIVIRFFLSFFNWNYFSISSLIIWFYFLFVSNLVLIFFFFLILFCCWICFVFSIFISNYFGWLGIWHCYFFQVWLLWCNLASWSVSRVQKIIPCWVWSFLGPFLIIFFISPLNIRLVGDWHSLFFNFLFFWVMSISCLGSWIRRAHKGWLGFFFSFIFF